MTITYAELDAPMDSKDQRIEELVRKIDHTTSTEPGHTCVNSPHVITMAFDMTDEDGRVEFDYARLGSLSHLAIWRLWDEMFNRVNDDSGKPDQITQQWLNRLLEIIDDLGVPLEV